MSNATFSGVDAEVSRMAQGAPASASPVSVGRLTACISFILFLSMLPVTMLVPVLRELVGDRFQVSAFWTHSFMSVNMIGAVLAAPLGGALADRFGRRKPILVAALLADAALLWALLHATSFPVFLTLRFFEGAAHILAVSTLMALASDWARPGRGGRTMGLIGASLIFGTACGAPLGGRIGQYAPLMVFKLGAGLAGLAAILAWVWVKDSPRRAPITRLADSLALIRRRSELLVPYAFAFIDRLCVGVVVTSFVLYLGECHGMAPAQRGGLLALFLFPFALLCYPAGRLADRIGRTLPMCVGSLGFGVVYALYGVLPVDWLWAAMLASGVLSALMFSPNLAMCSDLAPPDQRASAYAGFNVAGSLGFLCGPLLGGAVFALLESSTTPLRTYQIAFLIAGMTEVLCAAIALPWLLKLRRAGQTT